MSKNEYSFHTRKQRDLNPALTTSFQSATTASETQGKISPHQTRTIVLRAFDHFTDLKLNNDKVKYLSETQDTLSKEIVDAVNSLQHAEGQIQTSELTQKLEHLTSLHAKLKTEYTEILKNELAVILSNWPELFDKFIEGIDRETLDHCLSVFEAQMTGRIDSKNAIGQGMDFMKQKYNLPKDFFNKNAIDEFNRNLYQGQHPL